VCLSAKYLKKVTGFDEFLEGGLGPGTNQLDLGDDLDHDPNPGIFLKVFLHESFCRSGVWPKAHSIGFW